MRVCVRSHTRFAILGVLGSLLVALLFSSNVLKAAQTEEDMLAEINRLPEVERQARLVSGAKKEGTVTWYAAMNRPNLQEIIGAFEGEYPFIKVNVLPGSGGALLNRVLTENRAKSYQWDIFNTRSMTLNTMKNAGAIMRYQSPVRRSLRDGFIDKEGYFSGLFATPMVFSFNTKLVNPKDAPRAFEDLTNPKWLGKMGIDSESFDWLAALLDYYGESKGAELAGKIGNQKLNIRRGENLLTQLVAAGEFQVHIDSYYHEAVEKKKTGAPLDYNFPQPFIPVKSAAAIYLSAHPPHPYSAALLVDFLLSKKGQEIMFHQGRWVSHKDVTTKGPDDIGDRKTVVPSPAKWGDRYKELTDLYQKLLLHQ